MKKSKRFTLESSFIFCSMTGMNSTMKDELNLLPSNYYVGEMISQKEYCRLTNNTDHLSKYMRFFCLGDIQRLYNITPQNSDIVWDSIDGEKELEILQVQVATRNLKSNVILQLAKAFQRGVSHQIIIILSSEPYYKVIVPYWHKGKSKKISVVDAAFASIWEDIFSLRDLFSDLKKDIQTHQKYSDMFITFIYENLWNIFEDVFIYDPHSTDENLIDFNYDDDEEGSYEWFRFLSEDIGRDQLGEILEESYINFGYRESDDIIKDYEKGAGLISYKMEEDLMELVDPEHYNFCSSCLKKIQKVVGKNLYHEIRDGLTGWLCRISPDKILSLYDMFLNGQLQGPDSKN